MLGLSFAAVLSVQQCTMGTAPDEGTLPTTYKTVNGEVLMEAELYTQLNGTVGGVWRLHTSKPSYSGAGYMQASTDEPATLTFSKNNASVEYDIDFQETGIWYVHLRTWAADHTQNGFFAAIDGEEVHYDHPNASCIYVRKQSRWSWYTDAGGAEVRNYMVSFSVSTTGNHTFTLCRRDKGGSRVDRIWLSKQQNTPLLGEPQNSPDPQTFINGND